MKVLRLGAVWRERPPPECARRSRGRLSTGSGAAERAGAVRTGLPKANRVTGRLLGSSPRQLLGTALPKPASAHTRCYSQRRRHARENRAARAGSLIEPGALLINAFLFTDTRQLLLNVLVRCKRPCGKKQPTQLGGKGDAAAGCFAELVVSERLSAQQRRTGRPRSCTAGEMHLFMGLGWKMFAYLDHPTFVCCFSANSLCAGCCGSHRATLLCYSWSQNCNRVGTHKHFVQEVLGYPQPFGRREESGGWSGEQKANIINCFQSGSLREHF